ncbi:response regulator transcription factor [Agrobacterium larrymoorei]|uniref:Response regulator transcription factor n=1 Tax=Agrobacterium larrymoorei TaxID=160699 RepID=A0AAF0KJX8_9HYPH|nr:response regulator transcription factor [Agrobacterium larrymoorei]WHA43349.1 response regulator transcription factor [Agrobacterium larrymoorei]
MRKKLNEDSGKANFRADHIGVLIVEDDDLLRQSIADYLRQRGMTVSEAESGSEFRSMLKTRSHDVLVLDINLPDVSGFELAEFARSRSDMGIIILSARSGRDDKLSGYGKGADLYLTKPVDSEELTLAIANLARRRQSSRGSVPSKARQSDGSSLTLDRHRQTLTTPDGVVLKLSAREAAFLEYIAAGPNAIISRAEVAEIFGEDLSSPSSRLTDVALARLRARLRKAGVELPLQVVRNAGYRLHGILDVV